MVRDCEKSDRVVKAERTIIILIEIFFSDIEIAVLMPAATLWVRGLVLISSWMLC